MDISGKVHFLLLLQFFSKQFIIYFQTNLIFFKGKSGPVTHQTNKFGENCEKLIALPSGEITVDYKVGHLVFEST